MGFFSKPSAPVGYEELLADQSNRLSNNNYGTGFGDWNPTTFDQTDMDLYMGEKGNPFFTGTNRVAPNSVTASIRAPFLWNGNNASLRDSFKTSYDSYYQGQPSEISFNDTWHGPAIRPTYGASNGLSLIGTPSYWQDNNNNQLFNSETDDYLPEAIAGQAVAQETAAPQVAAPKAPPPQSSSAGSAGGSQWDRYRFIGEDPEAFDDVQYG